jgi:hypothetical protein
MLMLILIQMLCLLQRPEPVPCSFAVPVQYVKVSTNGSRHYAFRSNKPGGFQHVSYDCQLFSYARFSCGKERKAVENRYI